MRCLRPAACLLLLAATLGCPAGPDLDAGSVRQRDIRAGETHAYTLTLRAGDYVAAVVEQAGADVVVRLSDPSGTPLLETDSPNGARGPEPVHWVAVAAGAYRLEVGCGPGSPTGRYTLRVEARREATPRDRERAAAARLFAEAEQLRRQGGKEPSRAALERYREAGERYQAAGEASWQAVAWGRVGWMYEKLADTASAVHWLERSRQGFRGSSGGEREAVTVLNRLGKEYRRLGRLGDALSAYEEALELTRTLADPAAEATCRNNLGLIHKLRGDTRRALDAYRQALALWEPLGEEAERINTLANLSTLYGWLGQWEKAHELLAEALQASRRSGNSRAEARILRPLAVAERRLGRPEDSLLTLKTYLTLPETSSSPEDEALGLKELARTYLALGELGKARRAGEAALLHFRETGSRKDEAEILSDLGRLSDETGDLEQARVFFAEARRGFQEAGVRSGEASALYGAALAERRRGEAAAARRLIEEALRIVESLRDRAEIRQLRSSYLAGKQDYYELYVDVLAELQSRHPSGGYGVLALEASERRRARTLLDALLDKPAREEEPPLLGAEEIRRQLDGRTHLLEISLGDRRSFLWWVTPAEVRCYELAGRGEIETLARELHGLLSHGRGRQGRGRREMVARELAELLLGPVAEHLTAQRLVFVTDEALSYVPFGALPIPDAHPASSRSPGAAMLTEHEIVYLPSLSVLKALRGQRAGRPLPTGSVAVLADPVFDPEDPRLGAGRPPAGTSGPRDAALERLLASRSEAKAVLSVVPPGSGLLALDFDATTKLVASGALADYRFVHFATHSRFEADRPESMELVLSLVDTTGRPIDGLLGARQIYHLHLPVEMVVLSACRSGLGREVRGEGLVGLAQSFLYAGSARVMSSLWKIDDDATAELMERFYRAVFEQGERPAAALRSAQLSMLGEERWRAPYYWAGFILQGEWR